MSVPDSVRDGQRDKDGDAVRGGLHRRVRE